MEETAIVQFQNCNDNTLTDIEVPLGITANDLALAVNKTFCLDMDTDNIFSCYLVAENPIAFLRGNKTLKEFGIHNGTLITYKRK